MFLKIGKIYCKIAKDQISNVQFDGNSKSFEEDWNRKLIGSLLYLSDQHDLI